VAVAIVLLSFLFRSGAAMAATIVGALLGVMAGQILLAALAEPLGLPQFATVIAVMLGLGAGIDYSLLIIGRYREQVGRPGSCFSSMTSSTGSPLTSVAFAPTSSSVRENTSFGVARQMRANSSSASPGADRSSTSSQGLIVSYSRRPQR
jgi:MMPL family